MKVRKRKKISRFDIFGNAFMIIIVVFCLIPLALLLISSFSDNTSLVRDGYSFFPKKLSISAYKYLVGSGFEILRAYGMSFVVTGIGTSVSI